MIGLELAAAELYQSASTNNAFDTASQALAATTGAHHTEQSQALGAMVTAVGGDVPTESDPDFLAVYKPKVTAASDGAAKAAVFAEIENGFAATYFAAFDTVTSASLATVVAQLLATDAAHAVAWGAAANGQGDESPMPAEDAIPAAQTDDGQFEKATRSVPGAISSSASTTTEATS